MLPSDFVLTKQVAFLQTYCRSLPDRHFDQAATEMYFELLAHYTTESSQPSDWVEMRGTRLNQDAANNHFR